jgi:hypothetical protein
MIRELSLYRPTELKVAQTFHEFKIAEVGVSFCYAMGGTYKFKSKTIIRDGELEVLDREQSIPDLYISKEFESVLFSDYGIRSADDGVNLVSLPGWFSRGDRGDYLDSVLKRYYGISRVGIKYNCSVEDDECVYFSRPAVFLATPTDDAFSHFIFETFAKLSALDDEIISNYVFVVSDHVKNYQKEMLVRAGVSEDRIVARSSIAVGPIRFRELISIKWPSHNNSWTAPRALSYLIDFFSKKYSDISPASNSLIRSIGVSLKNGGDIKKAEYRFNYLDRDDERRSFRALTNEQQLKDEFVRRDFEIKTPGAMNFFEKNNMFSACKGLAGQYGGGLQLCFLAPFGTRIIVIQSELFTRPHIDFMAGILGFEVLNVQADQDDEEAHANASVKVDFESVVNALDKLGIFKC